MDSNTISIILDLKSAQALTKLNSFLGAASSGLSNLASIVGAGLSLEALEKIEEHLHTIGKLSQELGVTVETMAGLAYVSDRAGLSTEGLTRSMKKFSEWLTKSGEGSKNLEVALLEQADIFSKMENGPAKAVLAIQRFGKAGLEMIPILNQGSQAVAQLIERGADLAGIDERAVKGAEEFRGALVDLKTMVMSLGTAIVTEAGPSFVWLLQRFNDLIFSLRVVTKAWADLWKAIGSFSAGQGFRVPVEQTPSKAKGEPADAGFITHDEFETQKKALELEIKRYEILESIAKSDFTASADSKLLHENRQIELQIDALSKLRDLYGQAEASGAISKQDREANDVATMGKQSRLQTQIQPVSFADNFMRDMQKMSQAWGTLSQQIATSFTTTINHGVSLVSQNLTAIILKTKTWKQALQAIGQTILTSIVQAIIEMGVKWVISHVLMRGAMALTHAVGVALGWSSAGQVIAQEESKTPALAVNAAAASVSSYGAAAIIGMALALVAVGAIIGALVARESGGPVTAGRPYVVGERRAELFVPSQNGYIYPSVPSPSASSAMSGSQSGGASPVNIQVHNWNDEAAMTKHIRDNPNTHHVLLDKMRRNSHLIGARP